MHLRSQGTIPIHSFSVEFIFCNKIYLIQPKFSNIEITRKMLLRANDLIPYGRNHLRTISGYALVMFSCASHSEIYVCDRVGDGVDGSFSSGAGSGDDGTDTSDGYGK